MIIVCPSPALLVLAELPSPPSSCASSAGGAVMLYKLD